MFATYARQTITDYRPPTVPEVHISAGQSWRFLCWSDMNQNHFNPQTQTLLTLGLTSARFPSGVIPVSSGATLPVGYQNKTAGFTSAMSGVPTDPNASASDSGNACDIGRTAVLTQQLLRLRAARLPLVPVINFNICYPSSTWVSGPGGGVGDATCQFTGSIAGSVLTISAVTSGVVQDGSFILDGGVTIGGDNNLQSPITIQGFGTGTGGVGTYNLSDTKTLASRPLSTTGTAWYNQALINAAIAKALPDTRWNLAPAKYRSVGWTQGGSFDLSSPAATISEWTAMTTAYDSLALPGTDTAPLLFYVGIRAPNSADVVCSNAVLGGVQFVRANANGRTIGTSPWYQWQFSGQDGIHTGDYGILHEGQFEGLARYTTEDEGTFFRPLWRSLTLPITRSGQTLTVPFDRPTGTLYASGVLSWRSDPQDGIMVWPQNGWHVRRGASELTITPTIAGMAVQLAVTETLNAGDTLEVSYAWRGPGGPAINTRTGVGGNLLMAGPPSPLFPGQTIDSWAWPFVETVTV